MSIGFCSMSYGRQIRPCLLALFCVSALTATGQTFDVAADFSATNNPNGPWSYGFSSTLGGPLILYVATDNTDGLEHWRTNIAASGTPMLFHNPTANTIVSASTHVAPGGLGMHPGPDGEYAIARLTVPSTGLYHLTGSFFGLDSVGTTTDVHILTNGTSILDGEVTGFGPGTGPSFDLQVTLNGGDELDFAVGYGSDAGFYDDSTGLSAQIVSLTPVPSILAGDFTLLTETCTNGVIDPGERVTVSFGLMNVGTANTTNLVATLQAGGGVSAPTGPQTYGVLLTNGQTVARSFTFTGSGACGSTKTATLQLQDGPASLGMVTFFFSLGQTFFTTNFSENFDSVTAPDLPAGWASSALAAESPWVTTTDTNDTAPNSVFVPDPPDVGLSELDSPLITLPAGPSQLSFRNYYSLEGNSSVAYDGGVLQINFGGGGWRDILNAGGSFVTGGYVAQISTAYGNPLGSSWAWTGDSGGFITSVVNLPPSAAGQPVRFRWLCSTDTSVGANGWYVDTVSITTNISVCCTPPPVFISATRSGNVLSMSWSAIPGRSYQILYCADLGRPNWIALGNVLATDFSASITDTLTAGSRRFYRVAMLP